ncbi:hypothetical protein KCP77_21080 [Salmonella enterica subsp. enterica]|nr:hypothetical protein KCP77_21080 [Salmonella enterica subsp. enterica]
MLRGLKRRYAELRKHFPAAFLGRVTVITHLPLDVETSRGVIAICTLTGWWRGWVNSTA